MPLVTVITAARNAAEFLPETIESIQAQTIRDWNYVIVDDGSEDDTTAVVERYARADPRIDVLRLEESVGPYAAANLAAKTVNSRYIARIDADDVAIPTRLATQLAAIGATPQACACAGATRVLADGRVDPRVRRVPSHHNGVIKWMLWYRNALIHSTLLIETDRFHSLGGYGPERVAEDARMWSALVRAGVLAVTDEPILLYRRWPGQITAEQNASTDPARIRVTLDHMQRCAPGDWSIEDARDYRRIGEAAPFPPQRALELLGRFERAWRRDESLGAEERRELARHTAKRRLRHLRHEMGRRPVVVASAVAGHAGAVARSFTTVATQRGPSWP